MFISFLFGLYSGSPIAVTHPLIMISASALVLMGCGIVNRNVFNSLTVACALAFTLFGHIWMSLTPSWPTPLEITGNGQECSCSIIGTVSSETIETRSGRLLPVAVELMKKDPSNATDGDTAEWQPEHGTVLVKVERGFSAVAGTRFLIEGNVETVESALTAPFVLRYRPRAIIKMGSLSLYPGQAGPPASSRQFLNGLKYHLLSHLEWGISNPEDELVAGITFGRKGRRLDGNWSMNFYNSGLSHLIVASGSQVSILFMPLFFLLGRSRLNNPVRWTILIALGIALSGFAQLLGGEPSILRAALMGCVLLLAIGLGRRTSGLATLSAAGFFWLVVNPLLVHDTSFLLSFAASFGIIYITPTLFEFFGSVRPVPGFRFSLPVTSGTIPEFFVTAFRKISRFLIDIALITFAAQVGVFPALACTVGRISVAGLFANLVAVPIAQVILYLGALSSACGFINPVLPLFINNFLEILARTLMNIAEYFSRIPYANIPVDPMPGWFSFLFYAFIFLLIESRNLSTRPIRHMQSAKFRSEKAGVG